MQEYLTSKSDGHYYKDRDYRIKGHIDSTAVAQDLSTHTQFSVKMTESNTSILNECHILSRLGSHRNVIRFLGGVAEEIGSPTGPVQTYRMMFEFVEGNGSLVLLSFST